ncbi:PTS transporter subunit EIIC [Burkholderia lata]|uniref:PTS system N-acetylmuramic acid-specific EIIBC component n=1 Tax=Burkholderia lata (strain ATCC 17760 / DSM 23089 / LMG 22485 / NCIMB 9086 / R18194 / 383) TaxID=482957 RepID=A0A6P2GZ42_BURL3|nr:PTS transporter subunit EIIC [Burkholderia lata]VWB08908.1 PTS system EIIBC component [Burkholderia lata]
MTSDESARFDALARAILGAIGGASNVRRHFHCMTRLRLVLVDPDRADVAALKALPAVLGVVPGEPLQIVIGPGAVAKASAAFAAALAEQPAKAGAVPADAGRAAAVTAASAPATGTRKPAGRPARRNTAAHRFLRRIASIFTPLIPALIGAGLLNAIAGLLKVWAAQAPAGGAGTLTFAATVASIVGSAFFAFLVIQVGMNAAAEFGGTPCLGGATAGILILPAIAKLPAFALPIIGEIALKPGQGGLMGALLAGALTAGIERSVRARIASAAQTLLAPTVALGLAGIATLFVIMPVAELLTQAVGSLTATLLRAGGMPAAFVLAASFVGLLMFGLHQALIPIHAQLIAQYGYTALFPILAMSGCGQAGAAFALYFRTRDPRLKQTIRNTLPTCMLGVSEPLLYGVTLPLGRPLITASLGGGMGALVLGYCAAHGHDVGATTIGPANLMLIPLVTGPMGLVASVATYCVAVAVAYASGFVLTWFFGLSDAQRRADGASGVDGTERQPAVAAAL